MIFLFFHSLIIPTLLLVQLLRYNQESFPNSKFLRGDHVLQLNVRSKDQRPSIASPRHGINQQILMLQLEICSGSSCGSQLFLLMRMACDYGSPECHHNVFCDLNP
ncbi:hypothetical protein AtNW77_Chr1g0032391 [Arabidopsis thaliana]